MSANSSCKTSDSDVLYVKQLLNEPIPPRIKTPEVLNSTELSAVHPRKAITISTVASPRPRKITINSDSNDTTMLYGYGRQDPKVPPSLKDLNLPPHPFKISATMAVIKADPTTYHKNFSPPSPEPSDASPISTPPMNLSTIDGWDPPHTTTGDNTSYSEDEA